VIEQCRQALNLDHNSAAAYYLMGCAHLRLNQPEQAVQASSNPSKLTTS